MRAHPALIVRHSGESLSNVRVLARPDLHGAKSFYDLAGVAFGLLFVAFLLFGLNMATRAAPINPSGVAQIDPYDFPDDD